jgi:hypothetical protein
MQVITSATSMLKVIAKQRSRASFCESEFQTNPEKGNRKIRDTQFVRIRTGTRKESPVRDRAWFCFLLLLLPQ